MKQIINLLFSLTFLVAISCNDSSTTAVETSTDQTTAGGQENVKDDDSQKDVVKVAVGSKDHTTLVAALKQGRAGNVSFQCRALYGFCAYQCSI